MNTEIDIVYSYVYKFIVVTNEQIFFKHNNNITVVLDTNHEHSHAHETIGADGG